MSSQNKYHGLGVAPTEDGVFLYYQDLSEKKSRVHVAKSADGHHFIYSRQAVHFRKFFGLKRKAEISGDFSVSQIGQQFYLTCREDSRRGSKGIELATSENGTDWKKMGHLGSINERLFLAKTEDRENPYLAVFGHHSIRAAVSADLKEWNLKKLPLVRPRRWNFDNHSVSAAGLISAPEGLVVLYSAVDKRDQVVLGAALFDSLDFRKMLWRSPTPLWIKPANWKAEDLHFIGSAYYRGEILFYFQYKHSLFCFPLVKGSIKESRRPSRPTVPEHIELKKFKGNPIITARPENEWESNETFNPAAIKINDKVHFLYRAVGKKGMSVFGYASSQNGFHIDERPDEPAYVPTAPFEYNGVGKPTFRYPYLSGGGWGGCEDPRLTQINDRIYLTYTAFNGSQAPGVALSSISVADFLKKIWKWEKPILLSKPGELQKNWLLFSEKIRGKFAILHSINPKVMVDYFDDLTSAEMAVESVYNTRGLAHRWDNVMRGAAAPPIRTEYGWLVLYHAMDKTDPKHYQPGYWNKVGAMLLDYENPEKIICRYHKPILEATEHYEKEGFKPGVVYACGAIVKDDHLFVYYGGADSVSCVATAPYRTFLESLLNSPVPVPVNLPGRS